MEHSIDNAFLKNLEAVECSSFNICINEYLSEYFCIVIHSFLLRIAIRK